MNLRGLNAVLQCALLLMMMNAAPDAPEQKVVVDSTGIRLRYVAAGEFMMGSPASEKHRRDDENEHRVRISRGYFLGETEVTRGQFRRFVESTKYVTECERNGSGGYGVDEKTGALSDREERFTWRYTGFEQTDEHPVVNVSWNDAVAFCQWCSGREKKIYRLPTEAEWEFACRAGTTTVHFAGDDPELAAKIGNTADGTLKTRYTERETIVASDKAMYTMPVGIYAPNALGFRDMIGNVWEWCDDWYAPYPSNSVADPHVTVEGPGRVIRGGDWYHGPAFCRSAGRYYIPPTLTRRHGGFRVACDE